MTVYKKKKTVFRWFAVVSNCLFNARFDSCAVYSLLLVALSDATCPCLFFFFSHFDISSHLKKTYCHFQCYFSRAML